MQEDKDRAEEEVEMAEHAAEEEKSKAYVVACALMRALHTAMSVPDAQSSDIKPKVAGSRT